ncbi:MAG TPA: MATE family efflux transporter, partial [Bacillota bacterium]|nr:MATE family efflux transporter [Bacillota bacterium]
VAPSYLLTAVSFTYATVLRSTGKVVLPMLIIFSALSVNTLFNFLLIYGNYGFPRLGVAGAAIATAFARLVELVALLGAVYTKQLVPAAKLHELFNFSRAFTGRFFRTIVPVILNEFFWSLGVTMFALVYARMGTDIIAAVNIGSTVERLAMVLFFGMAQACAVMIGNRIGANDEPTAFTYARRLALLAPAIGCIVAGLLFILNPRFLAVYKVAPEVINLSEQILTIFTLTLPIRVFNLMLIVGILRSGGDTRFCLLIDTAGLWLIAVPLAFLAGLVWRIPPQGVYLLVASEELFKCGLGIYRLVSKKWLNNLTHHTLEPHVPLETVAEVNV